MLNSHFIMNREGYIEIIDQRNGGVLQIHNPRFQERGAERLKNELIREIKSSMKPGQSLELTLHGTNVIKYDHTMKLEGRVILNNVRIPNPTIVNSRLSHCNIAIGNVTFRDTKVLNLSMTEGKDLIVTGSAQS